MNKHQANIAVSLASRMEKARLAENDKLIALLAIEHHQLQDHQRQSKPFTPKQWFKTLWNRLSDSITQQSAPSIEWIETEAGGMIWRGYNPTTGEICYRETQGEMVDWLEAISLNCFRKLRLTGHCRLMFHSRFNQGSRLLPVPRALIPVKPTVFYLKGHYTN